jgi:hypothetical protein
VAPCDGRERSTMEGADQRSGQRLKAVAYSNTGPDVHGYGLFVTSSIEEGFNQELAIGFLPSAQIHALSRSSIT